MVIVRRWIGLVWCVAVMAYMGWGWYSYAGLYRTLAQWQMANLGHFYVQDTFFIPVILLAAPGLIIAAPRQKQGTARPTSALGLAMFGLPILAIGGALGYTAWQKAQTPTPVSNTTIALSTGVSIPLGQRVRIQGMAQTSVMSVLTEDSGIKSAYTYVPMTPKGWHSGDPLKYFLRTNRDTVLDPDSVGTAHQFKRGVPPFFFTTEPLVASSNSLPGPIRDIYVQHHVPLAEPLVVLDELAPAPGAPETLYIAAVLCGIIGAAFMMAGLIGALRRR